MLIEERVDPLTGDRTLVTKFGEVSSLHPERDKRTPAALEKRSTSGGGYLNYGAPDEPIERVRAAYGDAKFERLRQVKRRYDPHNLFRFNHNIPPAEA